MDTFHPLGIEHYKEASPFPSHSVEKLYSKCCRSFSILGKWKLNSKDNQKREVVIFSSKKEGILDEVAEIAVFILHKSQEGLQAKGKKPLKSIPIKNVYGGINHTLSSYPLFSALQKAPSSFVAALTESKGEPVLTFLPHLVGAADRESPDLRNEPLTDCVRRELTNVINNPSYTHAERELARALDRGENLPRDFSWELFFTACEAFGRAKLEKIQEEDTQYEKNCSFWKEFLHCLEEKGSFFLSTQKLRDFFQFYCAILGGEEVFRVEEPVFSGLVGQLQRRNAPEQEQIKSSPHAWVWIKDRRLNWKKFVGLHSHLMKTYEEKRRKKCNLIYGFCRDLSGLLKQKELLAAYEEQLFQLLDTLRKLLIDQERFEQSEAYLGLSLGLLQQEGEVQRQVELLLKGGDQCLEGGVQKDQYSYYQRAGYYYATACQLAQAEFPALAETAWKKLLRVEGEYLESKTHKFSQFLAACNKKYESSKSQEKEALMGEFENIAEYLGARGCYNAAYELYDLAYKLSIECKRTRSDLAQSASQLYVEFPESPPEIPQELLQKARSTKEEINALRQKLSSFYEQNRFPPALHDSLRTPFLARFRKAQKEMNEKFCQIVVRIFERCALFLDPYPEHAYALMGVGSISREEMCPYSDFEVALLTHEKSIESFLEAHVGEKHFLKMLLGSIRNTREIELITFEESCQLHIQEMIILEQLIEQAKSNYTVEGKTFKELLKELLQRNEQLNASLFIAALLKELEAAERAKSFSFQKLLENCFEEYKTFPEVFSKAREEKNEANAASQEFYQNLASFFDLSILALGETSWPILKEEGSPLPQGFSLDKSNNLFHHCNSPEKHALRQKEVGDVVQLNVLRSGRLLTGKNELFEEYTVYLDKVLNARDCKLRKEHACLGIRDYVEIDFSCLSNPRSIDIKKEALRIPILIFEALCLYYGIPTGCHTRDKITALCEKGIFPKTLEEPFHDFLTWGFALRAKAHLQAHEEKDQIELNEVDKQILITTYHTLLNPLKITLQEWLLQQDNSRDQILQTSSFFLHSCREEMQRQSDLCNMLFYLDIVASLQGDPETVKRCGKLHFVFGNFTKAKIMWQRIVALLEKEIPPFKEEKPLPLLNPNQKTPLVLGENSAPADLSSWEEKIEEKKLFMRLVTLSEEQEGISQGLKESWQKLGSSVSLPYLGESLEERDIEEIRLEDLLNKDWILFWEKNITDWLTVILSHEEVLVFFSEAYAILPKRYQKETVRQLLSSFSDKLPVLRDFYCEKGYIFSALVKREEWLKKVRPSLITFDEASPPPISNLPFLEGAHLEKGYLSEEVARRLFQGREFIGFTPSANRPINEAIGTYFKKNPECPGDEYAVCLLNHLITGQGSPPVDLLRVVTAAQDHLIISSEKVEGKPLHRAFREDPDLLSKIDGKQFSQMVLMALLINPEDGKPDNFIAYTHQSAPEKVHLLCVDNDHAFVKPFVKKGYIAGFFAQERIFIKTILFCLNQMNEEIHPEVRDRFLRLNPTAVLKEWLNALVLYNKKIESLFKEEALNSFWRGGILVPFYMHPDQLVYLHEKMLRMQHFLSKKQATHLELLKYIDTKLGSRYQEELESSRSPIQRFEQLTKGSYTLRGNAIFTDTTTREIKQHTLKSTQKKIVEFKTACFSPEENLKVLKVLHAEKEYREKANLDWRSISSVVLQEKMLKDREDWAKASVAELLPVNSDPEKTSPLRKVSLRKFKALQDQDLATFLKSCYSLATDQIEIRTLNLEGCAGLTSIGVGIITQNCMHLQKLSLENTLITKAVFTKEQVPYLRVLNLKSCSALGEVDIRCPSIQEVLLEGCSQLHTLRLDCPIMSNLQLKGCSSLKTYRALGQTPLTEPFFHMLKRLQENPSAFELKGKSGEKIMHMFLAAIRANNSLRQLQLDIEKEANLKEIDLSGHEGLSSLHISNNSLQRLMLSQMPSLKIAKVTSLSLKELDLQGNGEMETLDLSCPNLEWIYLSGSSVERFLYAPKMSIDERIFRLLQALQNLLCVSPTIPPSFSMTKASNQAYMLSCFKLLKICLENNGNIEDKKLGLEVLMEVYHAHPKLKGIVQLRRLPNDKDIRALMEIFKGLLKEKSFNFARQGIDDIEALIIADAVGQFSQLKEISLSQNKIGDKGTEALAKGIAHLSRLTKLYLWENEIGDAGMVALAEAFANLPLLQDLELSQNKIRDEGAIAFAQVLAKLRQLTEIRLHQNRIGDEGAIALGEVLGQLSQLKEIYLDQNKIGDAGARALANGIAHLSQLTTLCLGGNEIGDIGMLALAEAFANLPLLQGLQLCQNKIGDEGARALANGIAHLSQLTKLWLWGNEIGDIGMLALAEAFANLPQLQGLELSQNKIGDEGARALANGIAHLSQLTTLCLGGNEIGDIGMLALAEAFANLHQLQDLELSQNKISDEGVIAFAQVLAKLRQLTEIRLHQNRIGDEGAIALGEVLGQLSQLKEIDLHQNKIGDVGAGALAKGIASLPELTKLYLSENEIGDAGMVALASAFANLPQLQDLRLAQNKISDEGVKAFAQVLGKLRQLTEIRLSQNRIGDGGAIALGEVLSQLPQLKEVYLHQNKIGDAGARALANGIAPLSQLTKLYLWGNEIGDVGMVALTSAFANLSLLQDLRLSTNKIGDEGTKAFAQVLGKLRQLTVIELSKNRIGDEGAIALGEVLAQLSQLKEISLFQNKIGDAGARALAEGITPLSELTKLYLSENEIGDAGMVALASAFANLPQLQDLRLAQNKMGDEGVQALAQILGKLRQLTVIELSKNRIEDEGAIALGEVLSQLSQLKEIYLNQNKIGDEGARVLAKGIAHLSSLATLYLWGNEIGDAGMVALASAFANLPQLQDLRLAQNKMGDEGVQALAQILGKLRQLKVIELSKNRIGDEGAIALGEVLAQLSQLKEISLFQNKIGDAGARALAEGITPLSELTKLYLSENEIGDAGMIALAQAFSNLPLLQDLRLSTNKIGDEGVKAFAQVLGKLRQLTEIRLHQNRIGDEGAIALGEVLGQFSQLKEIYLNQNKIGAAGAGALAKGIAPLSQLTNLYLWGNEIGDTGLIALAGAIPLLLQLQDLQLGLNKITDKGVVTLSRSLKGLFQLNELNLNVNSIGDEGAMALAETFENLPQLKIIALTENKIGNKGVSALAKAITSLSQLTELYLWENEIGDQGARELTTALPRLSDLQKLTLGQNKIGYAGISALAKAVANFSHLTRLSLWGNEIGDEGALELAEAFEHLSELQEINLSQSKIGNIGAQALAKGLQKSSHLQKIYLWKNEIGDEGIEALVKTIRKLSSLIVLVISQDRVDQKRIALIETIQKHFTINEIYIWGRKEASKVLILSQGTLAQLKEAYLWKNIFGKGFANFAKALDNFSYATKIERVQDLIQKDEENLSHSLKNLENVSELIFLDLSKNIGDIIDNGESALLLAGVLKDSFEPSD